MYFILPFTILFLANKNNVNLEPIKIVEQQPVGNPIIFAFKDNDTSELLFFKNMEICPFWKSDEGEPESIKNILQEAQATTCKYIYFMYEDAYKQVIGHNENYNDPGRGTNIYSLRWFFEQYFSEKDWGSFEIQLKEYFKKVDNYIGYFPVKTLTSNSIINFKQITGNILEDYPYSVLLDIKQTKNDKEYWLAKSEFDKLEKQFIEKQFMNIMTSSTDFAESLMTAEWLFDSMQKAKAIDLTVIGMGYFKAVEQLMYELINCFQMESGLVTTQILVKDDATLGAMAKYYQENKEHIFNTELNFKTRKYIIENLFEYSRLRNGYFHKHNIKRIETVEKIKRETYHTIFLLIGSYNFNIVKGNNLGLSERIEKDDFYKLCEYINYHRGSIFVLKMQTGEIKVCRALPDIKATAVNNEFIKYTGMYFRDLNGNSINEKDLPDEIWTALIDEKLAIRKKSIVYKSGKFVGPNISKEEGFTY